MKTSNKEYKITKVLKQKLVGITMENGYQVGSKLANFKHYHMNINIGVSFQDSVNLIT